VDYPPYALPRPVVPEDCLAHTVTGMMGDCPGERHDVGSTIVELLARAAQAEEAGPQTVTSTGAAAAACARHGSPWATSRQGMAPS